MKRIGDSELVELYDDEMKCLAIAKKKFHQGEIREKELEEFSNVSAKYSKEMRKRRLKLGHIRHGAYVKPKRDQVGIRC